MENKVMNDICKDDYLIDDRGKNGVRDLKVNGFDLVILLSAKTFHTK